MNPNTIEEFMATFGWQGKKSNLQPFSRFLLSFYSIWLFEEIKIKKINCSKSNGALETRQL